MTAEQAPCTLCGVSSSELVHEGARHAPEVEVRRCTGCGLVSTTPMPSPEELDVYYADTYRKDYGVPPVQERYKADLDEARVRVQRLHTQLRPDWRLLEVGSGSGAFLKAVQPNVGDVVGIEPDDEARAWITDHLRIQAADNIEQAGDGPDFDAVVLFHVLEHVPNPVAFLQRLGEKLRPSGRLVIEVPNIDDALVSLYRLPAYLDFYFQKAHLYYFSKDTLASTLSRAGFTSDIQGIQRYDLSNHIRWMVTGYPGGQAFYANILGPSVVAAYAESLIEGGHSDTLWAVATKVAR
jgi:2-polyprenyl-3-methyl-5-hydroxy-6-metoxy-1,4-benzoquinol methylase